VAQSLLWKIIIISLVPSMNPNREVIALLLGDGAMQGRNGLACGAQRLLRDAAGRVSLEDVRSQDEFDRTARSTGCFKRGTPIYDPNSREIIGYEMEEVRLRRSAPGRPPG
jgi:hypothetical protein